MSDAGEIKEPKRYAWTVEGDQPVYVIIDGRS